jgi:hypothetical protein
LPATRARVRRVGASGAEPSSLGVAGGARRDVTGIPVSVLPSGA